MEFDLSQYTKNFKKAGSQWTDLIGEVLDFMKLEDNKRNRVTMYTQLSVFKKKPYFVEDIIKNCKEFGREFNKEPQIYFWGQVRKAKTGSTKK